jgi:hypothetical protein
LSDIKIENYVKIDLTAKEIDLINLIRKEIPYGSFKVFTHPGQPVRFEEGVKGIVFGDRK